MTRAFLTASFPISEALLSLAMQIKFLEEVIVGSNKPMSFDISKNKVCSFKY